ncbi:hypothetical protein MMC18_001025 [Xylographa bjoerkii]|nr:hypothetical protein [Xylographa bjoerkii]
MNECIDALTSIARDLEYLYVVIDALDECSGDERQGILDALEQLTNNNVCYIKVFVSSRDDPDLVHRLKRGPNILINANDNSEDIYHYVTLKVDHAIHDGRLCGEVSAELRAHIIERLCQKANGMFQWVKLSIERLRGDDIVPEKDLRLELGKLPEKLLDTYDPILTQLMRSAPSSKALALRVLRWLLCAFVPITTKQLIAAVSVSPNGKLMKVSIDDIINVSRTLVVLDEELDQFRLAHLSVREFLETKEQFNCVIQNVVVGQRCLVACMSNEDAHPDVVRANEELRNYANCCWGLHCSFSEESRTDEDLDLGPERNHLPKLFKLFTMSEGAGSPEIRRSISGFDQEAESLLITMPSITIEAEKLSFFTERMRACAWAPGQETPNFAACVWSFKEILAKKARTQESDLRMLNRNGHTCLHIAAVYSTPEIVQLLLSRGADPNHGNGESAIHGVAKTGSLGILNLLLKAQANLEARDNTGRSPLILAVQNNHPGLVKRLLKQGAKLDVADHYGTTPFHIAVAKGFHEVMDLLMIHGRLNNGWDATGYNILHLSILFQRRAILARLLSKEEIDINSSSIWQQTPLGLAVLTGNRDILTLLMKKENLDIKKHSSGWTPLLWAAIQGHDDLTPVLHAKQSLDYAELAMQFHMDRSGRYHHGPVAQFYTERGLFEGCTFSILNLEDDKSADNSQFVVQAVLGSMIPIDRIREAMKEGTKD